MSHILPSISRYIPEGHQKIDNIRRIGDKESTSERCNHQWNKSRKLKNESDIFWIFKNYDILLAKYFDWEIGYK